MQVGTWKALVAGYGVSQTKAGDPQVFVTFKFTDGPNIGKTVTWFGGFSSDKARDYTLKNLMTLGLRGNSVSALAKGMTESESLLDHITQFELELENHEYQGKTSVRVKFINGPGSAPKFENALNEMQAKQKLSAVDNALAALKVKTGANTTQTGDIPF